MTEPARDNDECCGVEHPSIMEIDDTILDPVFVRIPRKLSVTIHSDVDVIVTINGQSVPLLPHEFKHLALALAEHYNNSLRGCGFGEIRVEDETLIPEWYRPVIDQSSVRMAEIS